MFRVVLQHSVCVCVDWGWGRERDTDTKFIDRLLACKPTGLLFVRLNLGFGLCPAKVRVR